MTTKTASVPDISCGHCVKTIERELGELAGVGEVSAHEKDRTVTVSWDPDATNWEAIEGLLREIEFPPAA